MTDESRITEEELADLEAKGEAAKGHPVLVFNLSGGGTPLDEYAGTLVERGPDLVAEVRRLRTLIRAAAQDLVPSDGWCHGCNRSLVVGRDEKHAEDCPFGALEREAERA